MKPNLADTSSTSDTTDTSAASRREQRSLPRKRNFFETRLSAKRLRIRSVIALALACIAATAVMGS